METMSTTCELTEQHKRVNMIDIEVCV